MTLRIVPAAPDHLEEWCAIHNAIIPTAPLSGDDVAERATRNRLTLGPGRHRFVIDPQAPRTRQIADESLPGAVTAPAGTARSAAP